MSARHHRSFNRVEARYRQLRHGHGRGKLTAVFVLVGLAMSSPAAQATGQLYGPVLPGSPPPWPADFAMAPPPIPVMPMAGDAPPDYATADPINPDATCGDWHLSSSYGGRWPAASTRWEYSCTFSVAGGDGGYVPDDCWGSMCQSGTCWGWPYNCYASDEQRTDYFVWDGGVVFYGQAFDTWLYNNGGPSFSDSLFWDGPTALWYSLVPRHVVTVYKTGAGSGVVTAFPGGINCGDVCRASYPAGTEVVLGVQPDPPFAFAGWLGDCRYTSPYCHFWLDRDWSVTASFGDPPPPPPPPPAPPPNLAPVAAFGRDCDRLTCRYDAHTSTDPDGSIASYRWSFGDGDTGTNLTTAHSYAAAGTYDVELSVADDRGSVSTTTKSVTVSAEPAQSWSLTADFRVARQRSAG